MNNKAKNSQQIKKITALAVFAAVAYAVHFVHIPVAFLNLDFKDVITTVCGMYFGPVSGVLVALIVPILEYPTSSTGPYGLIMNMISSVTFVGVASVVYRFKKTLSGAIAALCAAVLSMTAIMMIANLFITPFYMGISRAAVVEYIPKLLLPFNAIKALLNAALTLCLYKPLTNVLKKTGFGKQSVYVELDESAQKKAKTRSIIVWIVGGSIAIISLCIIFFVLGGSIAFN